MTFAGPVFASDLIPDGSPVATSNMVTRIAALASITNGGAKAYADALVVHTNPTFSNEVLAVGLNIGTNEVAQINAILNEVGETPIGQATTVGGLLLALAAAVAWLKKHLKYLPASTAADRTVTTVTVSASTASVALPTPTAGAVTDLVVILDCRNAASIASGFAFTGNIVWAGGSAIAPEAGKVMVYGFTCDGSTTANSALAYVGNGISCG